MSGGIEAAADIATGSLVARAIEPEAGEHPHASAHGACLNCGTRLIGAHCHACGQSAHVHRTLGAYGHDLLHGVFHFEGKIWRTLPMLVLHPGTLTRRYIAGERARFVSPLALFLFTVFLMFATISALGGEMTPGMSTDQKAKAVSGIRQEIVQAKARRAALEPKIAAARAAGQPVTELEKQRSDLDGALKSLEFARGVMGESDDLSIADIHTGWARLDHGIEKANANPALVIYKLQTSAYKYSWGLIPLSVPFVALLFLWRRRFNLYDHAIFVTYSLSFMMLLVIVFCLGLTINAPGGLLATLMLVAPPVHMFAQLRGAYGLRKRSALWRTMALTIFAFVVLLSFVALLLMHGLAD